MIKNIYYEQYKVKSITGNSYYFQRVSLFKKTLVPEKNTNMMRIVGSSHIRKLKDWIPAKVILNRE